MPGRHVSYGGRNVTVESVILPLALAAELDGVVVGRQGG
jgi:hypothetical protein